MGKDAFFTYKNGAPVLRAWGKAPGSQAWSWWGVIPTQVVDAQWHLDSRVESRVSLFQEVHSALNAMGNAAFGEQRPGTGTHG